MYLQKACSKTCCIAKEKASYQSNQKCDINLSSIIQPLIENTGRFTENYAIDLLSSIKHIYDVLNDRNVTKPAYIFFGIRRLGVDHFDYIIARHADACQKKDSISETPYRKLYCLCIKKEKEIMAGYESVETNLYDITHVISNYDMIEDAVMLNKPVYTLCGEDYRAAHPEFIFM